MINDSLFEALVWTANLGFIFSNGRLNNLIHAFSLSVVIGKSLLFQGKQSPVFPFLNPLELKM